VFLTSSLRDAVARLWFWRRPPPPPIVRPRPARRRPVTRCARPFQAEPTLWQVPTQSQLQQHLYCGPVAVAALTGVQPDYAVMLIQILRDDARPVTTTYLHELAHVFQDLGYRLSVTAKLDAINPPTLAAWERQRTRREFERPLLVALTDHWTAINGNWFADTYTSGRPVRISDAPRRRALVRAVYAVLPLKTDSDRSVLLDRGVDLGPAALQLGDSRRAS
jgi:hypothetical protein